MAFFRNKRRGATRIYPRPPHHQERDKGQQTPIKRVKKPATRKLKGTPLETLVQQHHQALSAALTRLSRTPWATALTMAVIGIALSLPAGLQVLIDNGRQLSSGWDNTAQISVFLKTEVTEKRALQLAEAWRGEERIGAVTYISREQALEEFRRTSGLKDALSALGENPLPAVLVVQPAVAKNDVDAVQNLVDDLQHRPEVEVAQLDLQWLKRLYAIIDIAQRAVSVLTLVLVLAVLIIVGNTIRLMSQNYRDEIEVTKLLGATDAFVRRPFLYSGVCFGLAGGVIAWMLVGVTLSLLNGSVVSLAALYQSDFALGGLDVKTALTLLVTGVALGLGGSWLAVNRFLRGISPT